MQRLQVEIVNDSGVDGPAAGALARLAGKFECDVSVTRCGRTVNAKSVMGVMMLAARRGSQVTLAAEGLDEVEAVQALAALIASAFDPGELQELIARLPSDR